MESRSIHGEDSDSSDELEDLVQAMGQECDMEVSRSTGGGAFEAFTLPTPPTHLTPSKGHTEQIAWSSAAYQSYTPQPESSACSDEPTSDQLYMQPEYSTQITESRFSLAHFRPDGHSNTPASSRDDASQPRSGLGNARGSVDSTGNRPSRSLQSFPFGLKSGLHSCPASSSALSGSAQRRVASLRGSLDGVSDVAASRDTNASAPPLSLPDAGTSAGDRTGSMPARVTQHSAELPSLPSGPALLDESGSDGFFSGACAANDSAEGMSGLLPAVSSEDDSSGHGGGGARPLAGGPGQKSSQAEQGSHQNNDEGRCEAPRATAPAHPVVSQASSRATVDMYTPEMQLYIHSRAQGYKRLIDESLQRQGAFLTTPSKEAVSALALVVAMSDCETRWPYRTPGTSGGGGGSPDPAHGSAPDGVVGSARELFRSPARGEAAPSNAGPGDLRRDGSSRSRVEAPLGSGMTQLPSGSCMMRFGSVITTGQPPASAEHTSGAISVHGHLPQQHAGRPTSWGSSAYTPLPAHGLESKSGISSACSNAFGRGQTNPRGMQHHSSYAELDSARRQLPTASPRGLGCGLGQPIRKGRAAGGKARQLAPGLDVGNLPYLHRSYAEPAYGQEQLPGSGLTGRSRVSFKGIDVHQPGPGPQRQQAGYQHYAGKKPVANFTSVMRAGKERGPAAGPKGHSNARGAALPPKAGAKSSAVTERQRMLADLELKRRRILADTTARAAAARGANAKGCEGGGAGAHGSDVRRQEGGPQARPAPLTYEQLLVRAGGSCGGYQAAAPRRLTSPSAGGHPYAAARSQSRERSAGLPLEARDASAALSAAVPPRHSSGAFSSGSGAAAAAPAKLQPEEMEAEGTLRGVLWDVTGRPPLPHAAAAPDPRNAKHDAEWRPVYSVLSIEELLARPSAAGGAGPPSVITGFATSAQDAMAVEATCPGASASNAGTAAPSREDSEHQLEHATGFVIISRRNTREDAEVGGPSALPPASSLLELSSLITAPALDERQARGDGIGCSAGAAAPSKVTERGTQTPDFGKLPPGPGAQAHCEEAEPSQPMAAALNLACMAARSAGGAPGVGLATSMRQTSASAGGLAAGGAGARAAQAPGINQDAIQDRQQFEAPSETPVRARYAAMADSSTPPQLQLPQQQRGSPHQQDSGPVRGTGAPRPAQAASASRRSPAGAIRRPGAMGTAPTGRLQTGAPRSRSAPHARPVKGLARPPKPQRRPQPNPAQARTPLRPLPEFISVPMVPASPPPPVQSATPKKFRSEGGIVGLNRWTHSSNGCDDDFVLQRAASPSGSSPSTPVNRRLPVRAPEDMPLSTAGLRARRALRDVSAGSTAGDPAAAAMDVAGYSQGLGLMQAAAAGVRVKHRSTPALAGAPRAVTPPPIRGAAAGASAVLAPLHGSACLGAANPLPGDPGRASHQDCSPNMLSPCKDCARPWAAPLSIPGAAGMATGHKHPGAGAVLTASGAVGDSNAGIAFPRFTGGHGSPGPAQRRLPGRAAPTASGLYSSYAKGPIAMPPRPSVISAALTREAERAEADDCCLGGSPASSLQMSHREAPTAQCTHADTASPSVLQRPYTVRESGEGTPATENARRSANSYAGIMLARQQPQLQRPNTGGRVAEHACVSPTVGAVAVGEDLAGKPANPALAPSAPVGFSTVPQGTRSRSMCSMGAGTSSGASVGETNSGTTSDGPRRTTPAGNSGAQLALLHQAAWPGLHSPRVTDALSTLEAGIAVLEPTPIATPVGWPSGSGAGVAVPNGCFALFHRHAAAAKAAAASGHGPEGQRPVLLRVCVADGTVDLRFLRPRKNGSGAGGAATPPPAEQRVRVAALCGVNPPLPSTTSDGVAAAAVGGTANVAGNPGWEDDVVDPASRWLQLVMMEGGLLRLSACTPADHARLVLGINAAMLVAAGAVGEDMPLASVPLRGLMLGGSGGGKAP